MASTVDVSGGGALTYTAAAGAVDSNLAVLQTAANIVTLDDTTDPIAASVACPLDPIVSPTAVTCIGTGITSITISLGDNALADSTESSLVDALAGVTVVQNGGNGSDDLKAAATAGSVGNTLNGDAGNDMLTGGAGGDTINGGAGADTIFNSAGADIVDGGGNTALDPANVLASGVGDIIDYASSTGPVNVTLDGSANDGVSGEGDNISGVETIFTGATDDTLTGSNVSNLFSSGAGNDTINARDGAVDIISCGTGTDTAIVDADDVIFENADPDVGELSRCETVERPAPVVDPIPVTITTPTPRPTPTPTNPITVNPVPTTPTAKPAAKSLSAVLSLARDRSAPYRFTLKGKLGLPTGVTKAKGCTGSVTITAKRGTKTVGTKKVFLKKDCTYTATATVRGKGALKISARFAGNAALAAKTSKTLSGRAG